VPAIDARGPVVVVVVLDTPAAGLAVEVLDTVDDVREWVGLAADEGVVAGVRVAAVVVRAVAAVPEAGAMEARGRAVIDDDRDDRAGTDPVEGRAEPTAGFLTGVPVVVTFFESGTVASKDGTWLAPRRISLVRNARQNKVGGFWTASPLPQEAHIVRTTLPRFSNRIETSEKGEHNTITPYLSLRRLSLSLFQPSVPFWQQERQTQGFGPLPVPRRARPIWGLLLRSLCEEEGC
jgi:hypothetical protein